MPSADDELVDRAKDFLVRPDGRVALRLVDAAQALLDERAAALASASERACESGCAACCHMPVSLTLPEALRIAAHLDAAWSADERAGLRERLVEAAAAARADEDAYFLARRPCVFLDAGRCRIYAVRPLACRGHASRSRSACDAADAAPDDFALADAVPVDLDLRRVKDEIKTTLGVVMLQAGVHPLDLELASTLLLLDDEPDLERAWLAGADLVAHLDAFALASGHASFADLLALIDQGELGDEPD